MPCLLFTYGIIRSFRLVDRLWFQNIPIDVFKVTGEDAVFLQQAAHLTNGIYYRLEKPKAMIQYLMVCCISLVTYPNVC